MQRNCWSSAQYPRPNGYARITGLASAIPVLFKAGRGLVLDSGRTKADKASEPTDLAAILLEVEKFLSE
ncbi:MAG: hypothetical protein OSB11_10485 [Gammaproteobacteria bacterium]|jgi:hypothetical protein|nr:hypothetical protein [Gammaproteobacteria bacterium]